MPQRSRWRIGWSAGEDRLNLAEYALILGLIIFLVIVTIALSGEDILNFLSKIAS
jgi:Flp pilus assembly pilin Flp